MVRGTALIHNPAEGLVIGKNRQSFESVRVSTRPQKRFKFQKCGNGVFKLTPVANDESSVQATSHAKNVPMRLAVDAAPSVKVFLHTLQFWRRKQKKYAIGNVSKLSNKITRKGRIWVADQVFPCVRSGAAHSTTHMVYKIPFTGSKINCSQTPRWSPGRNSKRIKRGRCYESETLDSIRIDAAKPQHRRLADYGSDEINDRTQLNGNNRGLPSKFR